MQQTLKKKIFRWLKIGALLYAVIGIAIYYLQDRILFQRSAVAATEAYNFSIPFKEVMLPYDSLSAINIIQFKIADSSKCKGVVLYFHGNKKNISWYAKYAPYFTKHQYEVWMIDYPGYGKSTGPLTEARLYEYAEQLYKLAHASYKKDSIVIYGKSMGTGIASWLASRKNCRQLILETPYYSMTSLAGYYFPVYPVSKMIHYKIPSYSYLKDVIAPVTILQGTADWVVPYSNAIRLKESLKPTDEFITVEGGSHNNLYDYEVVTKKLAQLLQ